eukprot:CAMPEP_0183718132 /NCGR_PEP_ID=MMETSP0737-20130205/11472_1 /TAXON_ID=385413 /ORGANISM="Thalassiosira miniscula, Strain CCMP1093" /LENGTH=377 /DNA_ID=CAMNT_0025947629 /DNA_START=196 /DNA_END=1325 /DNA_ORIENTATION=+
MVEFGKRLEAECAQQGEDWQRHCIDYGALKHLIKQEKDTISTNAGSPTTAMVVVAAPYHYYYGDPLESPQNNFQFQYSLDREIEKAVLFVLQEQGTIASDLDKLAVRRAKLVDDISRFLVDDSSGYVSIGKKNKTARIREALHELRRIHQDYAMAARLVLRFVSFVDLNVTAVRKILKKHDKITKRKLSYSYLSAYTDDYVDSHLDQLYNDGGLSSLVATLRRAFKELHNAELELVNMLQMQEKKNNKHRRIKSMPASVIGGSHFDFDNHQRTVEAPSTPVASEENVLVTTNKEPLLHMIKMSRDRLKKQTKYVDLVAAQSLMFTEDDDAEEVSSTSSEMTRSQRISSFLNLISTFLYMTNYYIVAPTCGQYAASVG